ncbi:shikimate kinase [Clostridium perfringens]|uniref:shikimate kinase n=1 Tax=Clostridium perfringens TaxID=1502 RepID=UPI001CCE65AC|nr:shikimate kinase [Clostridium perfringens]MDK0812507.1 shikimate kinase [Clostridium perfringens]MDK0907721.1 shikimate kinase [Clostridium perfringens]MDZ4905865.1 AAA family ATPase [Clostridium perfringens]UBK26948.1 shikimate kinase [Clostridium perfringens]
MKKRGVLLIGMPGAGKTTIGRELSTVLKMNFLDMDEFIERSTGKEIKELFSQGEEVFRDLESKSCELLSTLKNVVISSGGGIVTREENMGNFKEFITVFINRPLDLIMEDIDTEGRPLLWDGKERITNLYRDRIDLYKKHSDIEIINDGTTKEAIREIVKAISDFALQEKE